MLHEKLRDGPKKHDLPDAAVNHFPRTQDDERHAPLAGAWRPTRETCRRKSLADPVPSLPAAEDSTEDAALDPQGIRALHRDRGIVGLAAVRIVNATGPFFVRRPHVDEDSLAV